MKQVKLFVIGTPIGNLSDISYRAVLVLKEQKYICCEDVREVQNLLSNYCDITEKTFFSYHGSGINRALDLLRDGESICLVSDRGTPCISDPGVELVEACYKHAINVVAIPGACAVTAFVSIAGITGYLGKFMFYGFLPKSGLSNELMKIEVLLESCPIVFFESPYRIKQTLESIEKKFGNINVIVGREITKMYECIYRGQLTQAFIDQLPNKGEYVFAIYR